MVASSILNMNLESILISASSAAKLRYLALSRLDQRVCQHVCSVFGKTLSIISLLRPEQHRAHRERLLF